MSTILRSLKRLEKEGVAAKGKTVPSAFGVRQVMHRAVRFAWLKSRFMQWGMLAAVLIAGGIVLYAVYSRPATKPSRRPPQAVLPRPMVRGTPPVTQAARAAFPRPQRPLSSAARPRAQITAPTKTIQNGVVPLKPMGPSDVLARKPAPSVVGRLPGSPVPIPAQNAIMPPAVPPQTERSIPSVSSVQPGTGGSPPRPIAGMTPSPGGPAAAEPANRTNARRSAVASAGGKGPFANAERMTDGRLKVQAIVWAPRPEDRMAVINSRIVREGSVIEDFSIIKIGEDAVYVKEGGRVLKVLFGQP